MQNKRIEEEKKTDPKGYTVCLRHFLLSIAVKRPSFFSSFDSFWVWHYKYLMFLMFTYTRAEPNLNYSQTQPVSAPGVLLHTARHSQYAGARVHTMNARSSMARRTAHRNEFYEFESEFSVMSSNTVFFSGIVCRLNGEIKQKETSFGQKKNSTCNNCANFKAKKLLFLHSHMINSEVMHVPWLCLRHSLLLNHMRFCICMK